MWIKVEKRITDIETEIELRRMQMATKIGIDIARDDGGKDA